MLTAFIKIFSLALSLGQHELTFPLAVPPATPIKKGVFPSVVFNLPLNLDAAMSNEILL